MNYVIGDIHNDNRRFRGLLKRIHFSDKDFLYLLGDLFDRSCYHPDPVGVYFSVLELGDRCSVIRGNHDEWLAAYILDYCHMPERKRAKMPAYPYNSFELLAQRLTVVDLEKLAEVIRSWPLQISLESASTKYLFAHAKTSLPTEQKEDDYYLMGEEFYI